MDDKPNILDNSRLHIENLMPETLYKTFFASPGSGKKLYRPLPCLTFAINWYLGKDDPRGYRAVNILIHVLTALFLFHTIRQLFKTPALDTRFAEFEIHSIALLGTTIWALHPIQIQAVTYIVQRMTSLATLFYLIGLLFYIKARLNPSSQRSWLLYLGCCTSFILSMASKENAATFPLCIVLVEKVFFPKREAASSASWISSKTSLYLGLLVFLATACYFTKGNPFSFLYAYEHRSFSLNERLLTEFRVMVFYISQIFYPHPGRFSIDHEIPISTSLTEPWTTLPAILMIGCLILIGVFQIKKRPLLGFGILFFFLNHLIESSVIPLEIIFEHRNYLPSAFLFVPVAAGSIALLKMAGRKSRLVFGALVICMALVIVNLGIATYLRNMDWASQWTLWADAARKAPGNARPLNVLAIDLGWNQPPTQENLDRALFFFHKSLDLYRPNKFQEADILGNIAAVYFKKSDYQKAVEYYEMTLQADPYFIKARYHLAETLVVMQEYEEASRQLDIVIKEGARRDIYYNLKGFVLLWLDRPAEALTYLRKALSIAPMKSNIHVNIGIALSRVGAYQNAEWFLNQARRLSPKNMIPLFCQVENSLRERDTEKARRYARQLLADHRLEDLQKSLDEMPKRRDIAPLSYEMIVPAIREAANPGENQMSILTVNPLAMGSPERGDSLMFGEKALNGYKSN